MSDSRDQKAQIEERNKRIQAEKASIIHDLSLVLKEPHGRRVIWWILSLCSLDRLSNTAEGDWGKFNDGKKSIGWKIIEWLGEVEIHTYPRLMMEMVKKKGNGQ